ncbi:hypothetical protein JQ581_07045 [Bradyrhizobium liaoningense]|uniref:hypothetical protein n=1 Tax=Bradyrhizobium liaoningense TaxID=43992 RepID=UPI001BAA2AFE|nr:hypothetical protein [Bradyrhizobium liaoningense]MBR0736680.1 hypothetical protein [Bradyrhizobium liaoningense]
MALSLPQAGDIIFFRKSSQHKLRHGVIMAGQRWAGVPSYQFIHAAIFISPFEIADATMSGVKGNSAREQLVDLAPDDYAVLRRGLSPGTQELIRDAAFYFAGESYDFRGLVRVLKQKPEIGASFCSVFVKKVLLELDVVPAESWASYSGQIYVGELYDLLKANGFSEIPIEVPSQNWPPGLTQFSILERGQNNAAAFTDFYLGLSDFGISYTKLFDAVGDDKAAILDLIVTTDTHICQLLEHSANLICEHAHHAITASKRETSWRDRERRKKALERSIKGFPDALGDFLRLLDAVEKSLPSWPFEEVQALAHRVPKDASREDIAQYLQRTFQLGGFQLMNLVQLTGCDSLDAWRRRSAGFLRIMRLRQRKIDECCKSFDLESMNCYDLARDMIQTINLRIKASVQLLKPMVGNRPIDEQCSSLAQGARGTIAEARKAAADDGTPSETFIEWNATASTKSDERHEWNEWLARKSEPGLDALQ